MKKLTPIALSLSAMCLIAACVQEKNQQVVPFDSSYKSLPSEPTILRGAIVLTGTGIRLERADVLMENGTIVKVGSDLEGDNVNIVDAEGMWVTPGVIDVHSHLGVYGSPGVRAHSDGEPGPTYSCTSGCGTPLLRRWDTSRQLGSPT